MGKELACEVLDLLATVDLSGRVAGTDLEQFVLLLYTANTVATANGLLETITPAGLASLCRSQEATAQALTDFCRVSTKNFRRRFLRQFSAQDVAGIFERSHLRQVGSLIQYRYPHFKDGYALFREQFLEEKLATEPLVEISKFVHSIGQVPEVGKELACEVLDLLVPLSKPGIVKVVIEKSGVRGIELLIHNVASIDERYLPHIRQALQALDLTEKLVLAGVGDLGYLLWNVFAHVDQGLSRDYCRIIDGQQRSKQLREVSLNDLCRFLWNLTQISDLSELQTLNDPAIKERLVAAWGSGVDLGANLLGIIATTRPEICEDVQLPPIETQTQKEHLIEWLKQTVEEQHPYALALTARGLRAYDESEAQELVWKWLPISEASQLLEDALDSAITPQALALLQQTHDWLSVALFEETIE